MTKRITYGVDEKGNRLGEAHQRAKLSDKDVELIRDIWDEGMESLSAIAAAFGVHKSTISDIVNFRRRATSPAAYKTGELKKPPPLSRLVQLGIQIEHIDPNELDG